MIESLLILFVVGIVGLVLLAVLGAVFHVFVGLVGLILFKVVPILLLGWLILKFLAPRKPKRVDETVY